MSEDPLIAAVEKQEWLAPIQEKGEAFVKKAFESAGQSGVAVKNALHGVWLGHPLHAAITDVPVGSWTVAFVLDLLETRGEKQYTDGADAAVAIGLVGAVGAALSGLTDWSDTTGKRQRVGAMHGLLNTAAALLYGSSYALRKRGKRGIGRGLGFAGYGIVLASAYLGGAISYSLRTGVDNAADPEDLPEEFTPLFNESELPNGVLKKADVNGIPVVLCRIEDKIFALGEKCSHLGGPLSEGKLEGDIVQCPWHGSRFCLRNGAVVDGPATHPQPALDVMVKDGQIFVRRQAK